MPASSSRNNFGLSGKTRCIDLVLITTRIAQTLMIWLLNIDSLLVLNTDYMAAEY
jgi:hypothetical protein